MRYDTIEDAWERFRGQCMRPGVSPVAVQNARTAFFAGAATMLSMLSSAANVPEDEGEAAVERWHGEVERFADRLKEGGPTR